MVQLIQKEKRLAADVLIPKEEWLCLENTCQQHWTDEKGILVIQPHALPVLLDTETLRLVRTQHSTAHRIAIAAHVLSMRFVCSLPSQAELLFHRAPA